MIKIDKPNYVFNAHDVDYDYVMTWIKTGYRRCPPAEVAADIARAGRYYLERGKRLKNVVFNCHGNLLGLSLGGIMVSEGRLTINNLVHLSQIAYFQIDNIWLASCRLAEGAEGIAFCTSMAKVANAPVIASAAHQIVGVVAAANVSTATRFSANYFIDNMEGPVYRFLPDGTYKTINPNSWDTSSI